MKIDINRLKTLAGLNQTIVESSIPIIDASNWDEKQFAELESLFDKSYDDTDEIIDDLVSISGKEIEEDEFEEILDNGLDLTMFFPNAQPIARIEDNYGWDDVFELPTGHLFWFDRNSGGGSIAKPSSREAIKSSLHRLVQ